MNFFEHQDQARRNTVRLVVLFILAVLAIMFALYVVILVAFGIYDAQAAETAHAAAPAREGFIQWDVLFWVCLITLAVVGGGTAFKLMELSSGGARVAEMLGGKPIDPATSDPDERKLMNVVEEMAIASGTPVPPVYVLEDEAGINAFAAGYQPDDAVIGVTRGCIERLSRDELQGVVAHEFAHILNGDMRLNIRLIGILHGILLIGLIGSGVLRVAFYSSMGSRYRTAGSSRGRSNPLPLIALGLALMVIGYVGVFFGNMIKAAVSRQREYLADASAVQFTRQPSGLAGALKKIGGFVYGSNITNSKGEQVSHMFFSQGFSNYLGSLLATHPPLTDRIKRVDPSFDGNFPEPTKPPPEPERRQRRGGAQQPQPGQAAAMTGVAAMAAGAGAGVERGPSAGAMPAQAEADIIEQIGQPSEAHLAYAAELIESLPAPMRAAAHEPYGARALIHVLLLSDDDEARPKQKQRLRDHAEPEVAEQVERLEKHGGGVQPEARLPLVEMALPALQRLSPRQYQAFRDNVTQLILADDRVSLFEWSLRRVLLHHLDPHFGLHKPPRTRYYSLKPMAEHCALMLSTLAYAGQRDQQAAQQAFEAGTRHLGIDQPLQLQPPSACGLKAIDDALETLAEVSPREKRKVVKACAACIVSNREVNVKEGELLRAICDSLDAPMPPLLPGQQIG